MTNEKYDKLLTVLRNSMPELESTHELEVAVRRTISKDPVKRNPISEIFDFLFAWVYIGWVRKALVISTFLMIIFFLWQQNRILNQIDKLNRHVIMENSGNTYDPSGIIEKEILMYKLTGQKYFTRIHSFSDKELDQFIDSLNEMKSKYGDIIKIIEEDPELKDIIEKRLNRTDRRKINL